MIVWGSESVSGKDIVVTQEDIREVQLAKAAIFAGVTILMKKAKCRRMSLQRLLIAGAFGTYVDVHSAKIIGLFPDIPTNRIQFVGNAAGSGARMALISDDERKKADSIAGKMRRRIELGTDPDFQKEFLNATKFPHSNMNLFPNVRRIFKT